MSEFSFQALGTAWSITVDGAVLLPEDAEVLVSHVAEFEKRFSRFQVESEVNQFREAKKGEYQISKTFAELLQTADTLRTLTNGLYDPAIGALMEHSGYDAKYRLTPDQEKIAEYQIPKWTLNGDLLYLEDPTVFDLGGIGKGYCIDLAVQFLQARGYQYVLVEAGGDMYATEKQSGNGFQIALEWPGKPDLAYGTIELRYQGLAASDSFRRRWQDWHHIIDLVTKKPIANILGCTAVARNAFFADCMTSGLFLTSERGYSSLASEFEGEYVVFTESDALKVSQGWPGELFT